MTGPQSQTSRSLFRLTPESRSPIGPENLMARLFNGEVVLVQGGMNIVGGVQPIRDAILAEVQEVAGPEAAQTLRAAGLVISTRS